MPYKRSRQNRVFKTQDVTAENLLNGHFAVSAPNRIWTSDITCFWTRAGWLYMAVVMDLYSRRIIGWAMKGSMREELTIDALQMALARRKTDGRLIHHSDRGAQYTSHIFRRELEKSRIAYSLSRKGNCYDNAAIESFFKTVKTELNLGVTAKTREEARIRLFDYIELFYNSTRLHSTLGYVSPQEFERKYTPIPSVH
jgi:putative transposase